MKTILVPTDFSADADNALLYAAELNKTLKAEIILYHSYLIPVAATDLPIAVFTDEEIRTEALTALKKTRETLQGNYPGMLFRIQTSHGYAEDRILRQERVTKSDLVVMGTRGADGLREILIGSNAATVAEKSICPVISVPEKARMKGLNKIVFAANYGTDDFKNVYDVIDIARQFGSEVILLHISTGKTDKTVDYDELSGFAQHIEEESNYPRISFKLLEDRDVYDGLNFYLEEIRADMLAISMRNRKLAQKIFSRSLTKKMVYHSDIPVLCFHTDV